MWQILGRLLHRRPGSREPQPVSALWQTLDQAAEPFRQVFESAPMTMALTDADYRFLQVNRAGRELLGYTEPELALRTPAELNHHDDLAVDLRLTGDIFAGRVPRYQRRKRFLDSRRNPVLVQVTAVPLRDRAGHPLYQLLMAEDMRSQAQAREQIHQQTVRLRHQDTLLDLVRDAVIVRDPQLSVVTYWSPGAFALYGWGPVEAVGRVSHRLLQTRFPAGQAEVEAELYRQGYWEGELVERAADGAEVAVASRWFLEPGEGDQPRAVIQVDTDLTAQKRAEAEATAHRDWLDRLAAPAELGLAGIDRHGACTFLSDVAAELLGYRPEEAVGLNLHNLVHHRRPDGSRYPEEQCPIFRTVLTGQSVRGAEEVLWRRDGVPLPVEFSSQPVLERGACVGAVVAFRDVTERLRLRERLARAPERQPGPPPAGQTAGHRSVPGDDAR